VSFFYQHHRNALDAKGRVFMPAAFRRDAPPEILAGEFLVTPEPDGHLIVRPKTVWDSFIEEIRTQSGLSRGERNELLTVMYSLAQTASIDRQNRLVLSPQTRKALGISPEEGKVDLVLVGAGTHFEIWRADRWAGENVMLQRAGELLDKFNSYTDPGHM